MRQEAISKSCTKCNHWKPVSEFNKRAASNDGLQPLCRDCQKARDKAYIEADPKRKETRRRRSKKWQEENQEQYKQKLAEWKAGNKEHKSYLDKKASLWSHYKLTMDRYLEMLDEQNYCCKICNRTTHKLYVDHDHSCCPESRTCGKCTRGLVCQRCNILLGMMENNDGIIESAEQYIAFYRSTE